MENTKSITLQWGGIVNYVDPKYEDIQFVIKGLCEYETSNDFNKEALTTINQELISCVESMLHDKSIGWEEIPNLLEEFLPSNMTSSGHPIKNVKIENFSLTESSNQKIEDVKRKSVTVIETDAGAKDGQNKCPKCGATDISLNVKTGNLRCSYCRCEFEPEKAENDEENLTELYGQVMGSGATDIQADAQDIVTFKCSSCGAEVVIDTASSTQARCHWCRHTLSINQQIPNGSIPDMVLPFGITKDVAQKEIQAFVAKRKFLAHPKFKEEFTTNNIMGVYFPYMLVDVNAHANLIGEGEHETRKYYRGSGNDRKAYYDADLYHVEREFDITIDDLSVESSKDKLNNESSNKTNNVINAIMPFDTENCVKWNANYLKGYTSERRDTNIDDLRNMVDLQSKDIVRFSANKTLETYDRGVMWKNENLDVKGQAWKAAYLPVWLYSYQQVKGNQKLLHYVAVNARTKEIMGSVPIHMPKLILMSFLVEILAFLGIIVVDFDYEWTFLSAGLIYFFAMYSKYRNAGARHKYETETKTKMSNLRKVDRFLHSKKGLTNSKMSGANNTNLNGQSANNKIFQALTGENMGNKAIDAITENSALASFIKDNIDKK